jgi:hypothetical protein
MGKFKDAVMVDLSDEIERIEKKVKKIIFNSVGVAQEINRERFETGFMTNNWYFGLTIPAGTEKKRPPNAGEFQTTSATQTAANLRKWNLGDVGYVINNVEYASYHDLGTVYITPLFLSFQVETYVEKQIRKIR